MSENNTAIEKVNVNTLLQAETGTTYCTVKADSADREQSKKIYNALNNPDHRISDFINKKIDVSDVLIEAIQLVDSDTGEVDQMPRVVLISPDGESYQAVSKGIFNAIRNMIKVFGEPTWKDPITVVVKQQQVGRGSMLTLDIA